MKRFLIIFNPVSGSNPKKNLKKIKQIKKGLKKHYQSGNSEEKTCKVKVYKTKHAGDGIDYVANYQKPFDVIVAAGGDGTVNEVINGLIQYDQKNPDAKYKVATIATGTTNVLAMELGLPTKINDIVAMLVAEKTDDIYLGRINGRRFILMAGVGFDAWVVDNVNLDLKKKVGKLAYVWSMLKQIWNFGKKTYQVTVNEGMDSEQILLANSMIITNGKLYGGQHILSRNADLTKNTTQIILLRGKSPLGLLPVVLALPFNMAEKMPGVVSLEAKSIKVELLDSEKYQGKEPVQADGDSIAELPLDLVMEDQSISLVTVQK